MRRLVLFLVAVLVTASASAWGYWSGTSAAGGSGATAATTVNAGATPTATASAQSVTVSWATGSLANGQAVTGYLVRRYDTATNTGQDAGSGCATVTTTSCTETNVPAGSWRYTVTPRIGTHWRGAESAASASVTVAVADTTAPTNDISVSTTSGGAALTGTTVYYRGVASGELRLSNAVTDSGSGPASSTTGALSGTATGWSHTGSTVSSPSGGPYVSNPFTWAAATTSAPSVTVTGRDVNGNSAATTLTFADDSTQPAASLSYVDGFTSGTSVNVTFSASDAGSGVAPGTARLQRSGAPLTNGVCGTFGSYITKATAPTSPYTDTNVGEGRCYKYQYVVSDRVGNTRTITGTATAKVNYAGAVSGTSGLLSHWRLGEATTAVTAADTMNGTTGTLLTARTGEVGAGWTLRDGFNAANTATFQDGRVFRNGQGHVIYMASGNTGTNADYAVEADVYFKTVLAGDMAGVVGRMDPNNLTYYAARWEAANNRWALVERNNGGTATVHDSYTPTTAPVAGMTYRVRLEMVGSTVRLYVNGVLRASYTDTFSPISSAFRAGFMDGNPAVTTVSKNSGTGIHLDNFQVSLTSYPRAADSKGSNTADYKNAPAMGATGALAGDANTATRFDGVNDYVQAASPTGLPLAAASRSVEAWFKTTSADRQVLYAYGTNTDTQQFGLWLNAGGTAMTAWGFGSGAGHNKEFALPAAANDGMWHHSVVTYNGTSLTLYLDGVAVGTQAATRNTVIDDWGFTIGAIPGTGSTSTGGYFNGWIDEVAFYTSVLSQATVTDHYQLGGAVADTTGPTGGSVDASNLGGTGGRYSTSTTLSLVLDPGDDPSGIADSGATLKRATATLTNGTCGTFGTYTLVTGGTDPISPKSDTVTDHACYRYEYAVTDSHGNPRTYTSGDIKVDTTAPAAPTLGFSAFTNAASTGSTVYYRSAAANGSFTVTPSGSDAQSGLSSYTYEPFGAGWTSTPGAGNVTYAWTAANPSAPGTKNWSATNNAGLTSPNAPFTTVADDTPPSGGTVTYADVATSNTTVSVSFTTGTDSGSGLGSTHVLQRATAPLTDSTCGNYGSWTQVGGTNPATPYTDTVTRGACYQYRYVVADRVGNTFPATSNNVVKVWPTYSPSISGAASLVNYFRIGEATTSADTFTGSAAGTLLSTRTAEATWTKHVSSSADLAVTNAGRVRKGSPSSARALYYTGAVPSSANYTVEADVHVASNLTDDIAGVVGRLDTANTSGTFYVARYEQSNQRWNLFKVIGGAYTHLGQSETTQPLTVGATYRLALDMSGTTIRVLVNGVQHVSVVDNGITAAGRGGLVAGFHATATTTVTDTTGMHLDNFTITPPMADAKSANHGDYHGGLTLGVAGAIAGDSNTAAQFDGVNDYATFTRQVGDDFSLEFWFKTGAVGAGSGTQWWSGSGLVDGEVSGAFNDFGVSIRSDGRILAGVGNPDTTIVSTNGGYNNSAWHHVVFTRSKTTGKIILYVDGVEAGSATGNLLSLTSPVNLNLGRLQTGINYYSGMLDEVAIYNTVLTPGAVAAHNGAGR